MKPLTLMGVVAELPVAPNELNWFSPVMGTEDELYLAEGPSWTTSTLRKLTRGERRFVRPVRRAEERVIDPGQGIWIAGRNFIEDVRHAGLTELAYQFGAPPWQLFNEGAKWRVGTSIALDGLRRQMATQLRDRIHKLLFDPLEKSHGDARRVFDLYREVDLVESAERSKTLALFYYEMRMVDPYGTVRQNAVAEHLYPSAKSFDADVESLRDWLRKDRLSESGIKAPEKLDRILVSYRRPAAYDEAIMQFAADKTWQNLQLRLHKQLWQQEMARASITEPAPSDQKDLKTHD